MSQGLPDHLSPDEFRELARDADTLLDLARESRLRRERARACAAEHAPNVEFPGTGPATLGKVVNGGVEP